AGENVPGRRDRPEPHGDVDGAARHKRAALACTTRDDLTAAHADMQRESRAEQRVAAPTDRERGVQSPFDVILLSSRSSEGGQNSFPGELLERPARAFDLRGDGVVVTLEQSTGAFRILRAK